MSEVPGPHPEQNQNLEQIEIPQELFEASAQFISELPTVSAEQLRMDFASKAIAEKQRQLNQETGSEDDGLTGRQRINAIQEKMNQEGLAEAIIDKLQEDGVIDKKQVSDNPLDGFAVIPYRERQEESEKLSRRQKIMSSKIGKSALSPMAKIAKENWTHNTKTRPQAVDAVFAKITGEAKRDQAKKDKEKKEKEKLEQQDAAQKWAENRTRTANVQSAASREDSAQAPERDPFTLFSDDEVEEATPVQQDSEVQSQDNNDVAESTDNAGIQDEAPNQRTEPKPDRIDTESGFSTDTYNRMKKKIDFLSADLVQREADLGNSLTPELKFKILSKARKSVANKIAQGELGRKSNGAGDSEFYTLRDRILAAYDAEYERQLAAARRPQEATTSEIVDASVEKSSDVEQADEVSTYELNGVHLTAEDVYEQIEIVADGDQSKKDALRRELYKSISSDEASNLFTELDRIAYERAFSEVIEESPEKPATEDPLDRLEEPQNYTELRQRNEIARRVREAMNESGEPLDVVMPRVREEYEAEQRANQARIDIDNA